MPTTPETKRGLSKREAADYLGLSAAGLAAWVRQGIVPPAIPGTHRWDRRAIDAALDKRSGLNSNSPSALEAWKAGRYARAS